MGFFRVKSRAKTPLRDTSKQIKHEILNSEEWLLLIAKNIIFSAMFAKEREKYSKKICLMQLIFETSKSEKP